MSDRYSVKAGKVWGWDVRTPQGVYVGRRDTWGDAIRLAHHLSTIDQIRDGKYDDLFSPFEKIGMAYRQTQEFYSKAFQDFMRGFSGPNTTDYALAI